MTGILKVDQWKDSGDNALMTSDGAGVLTANAGIVIPSGATITNNGTASGFPGLGKIGQVVSQTLSATQSTSSTSFVTNFSASITPSSASSKILVTGHSGRIDSDTNGNQIAVTIYRDATNLFDTNNGVSSFYFGTAVGSGNIGFNYLDSPSTTSAITYSMYYRKSGGGGTVWLNNAGRGTITLMEVLA